MDEFTGYKTAITETSLHTTALMDPFHVVSLAGKALDQCHQWIQQATLQRRGRSGDPLYGARKTLLTGQNYLTDKQQARLEKVFSDKDHQQVQTTWQVYQQIVSAFRNPQKQAGKADLTTLIDTNSKSFSNQFPELRRLGRTMHRRADDILTYFDHTGTSNGPTKAINGRIEHLRGTALGFRDLLHYITRALLDTGGFRQQIHSILR